MEFVPFAVPTKSTIIRYFEESLKLSIKTKIQDATYVENYEKIIAKAVRTKDKTGL